MPAVTDFPSGISVPELDALLKASPGRHNWAPEEDAILRQYYVSAAAEGKVRVLLDFLCARYGPRSIGSLHERARRLGLQRPQNGGGVRNES